MTEHDENVLKVLLYLNVGIIPSKHSSVHQLQGLKDFQGRVIIVLSRHTPTEYQCLGTVQAQNTLHDYVY